MGGTLSRFSKGVRNEIYLCKTSECPCVCAKPRREQEAWDTPTGGTLLEPPLLRSASSYNTFRQVAAPTSLLTDEARGVTLAHTSLGASGGAPCLLIGGSGDTLTRWAGLEDMLVASGLRLIKFDHRDIGESSRFTATLPDPHTPQAAVGFGSDSWINTGAPAPDSPIPCAYTLDDMAADALAVLDCYGIAKAHVIGFAMGGQIAQVLAIKRPDRLLSATLIMSAPLLLRAVHERIRADGSFVKRLIAAASTLPAEGCTREEYVAGQLALAQVIWACRRYERYHA